MKLFTIYNLDRILLKICFWSIPSFIIRDIILGNGLGYTVHFTKKYTWGLSKLLKKRYNIQYGEKALYIRTNDNLIATYKHSKIWFGKYDVFKCTNKNDISIGLIIIKFEELRKEELKNTNRKKHFDDVINLFEEEFDRFDYISSRLIHRHPENLSLIYRLILPLHQIEEFVNELQYINQTFRDNKLFIGLDSSAYLLSVKIIDKYEGCLTPEEIRLINSPNIGDIYLDNLEVDHIYFDFRYSLDHNNPYETCLDDYLKNPLTRLYKLYDNIYQLNDFRRTDVLQKYRFLVNTLSIIDYKSNQRIKFDLKTVEADKLNLIF